MDVGAHWLRLNRNPYLLFTLSNPNTLIDQSFGGTANQSREFTCLSAHP